MHKKIEKVLKNKIFGAIVHVVWIIIMSVVITIFVDEVFNDSFTGNIVGLILIAIYVIFSFARKYQMETSSKRTLEITDISLTLLFGIFMMNLSSRKMDSVGFALRNILSSNGTNPPMLLFYLGVLLVLIAIIRTFLIHKNDIKYTSPKI
ncbi:MAG: hypothetical protein ACP5N1_04945 [Candidatus Woesearchaeota archaeon]